MRVEQAKERMTQPGTMRSPQSAVQMREWTDSSARRMLNSLAFPIIYALNRPSMQWFSKVAYDFALQCNGFSTAYRGKIGLTLAEENFLKRHLAGRRGGVFFDVGANHGAYTDVLHMLVPDAQIYAFEPHPTSFALLNQREQRGKTVLLNKALSDTPGHAQLYDFAEHDGSTQASLSSDAVGLFTSSVVQHDVEVTTLDDFLAEHGVESIDLLKVDTEGFDLNVLRGAREALAGGRVKAIQFEFIPANIITKTRIRDFIEVLAGYDIFRMCLNGRLIPLQPYEIKRCEVYVPQNLVALLRPASV